MGNFDSIRLIIELVVGLLVTPFALVLWYLLRKAISDLAALERRMTEAQQLHEKELAAYKLHVSETYSTKNDLSKAIDQFSRAVDAVFAKLERIEDKLDSKADKATV